MVHFCYRGTLWRSLLRHCTTNRKVAGLGAGVVIGIFHWLHPSGRTMALGVDSALTEMSTVYILGVNAAGAEGWQPYHLHMPIV